MHNIHFSVICYYFCKVWFSNSLFGWLMNSDTQLKHSIYLVQSNSRCKNIKFLPKAWNSKNSLFTNFQILQRKNQAILENCYFWAICTYFCTSYDLERLSHVSGLKQTHWFQKTNHSSWSNHVFKNHRWILYTL